MYVFTVWYCTHRLKCALVLLGVLTSLCYAAAPSREEMFAEINISAEYEMTEEEQMLNDINEIITAAKQKNTQNTSLSTSANAFRTAKPSADYSQYQYQQFTDPLTQRTYTELEPSSSTYEQIQHQQIFNDIIQDDANASSPNNTDEQASGLVMNSTSQYDHAHQPETSQETAKHAANPNPMPAPAEMQLPKQKTAALEEPMQNTLVMKEKDGQLTSAECCYKKGTRIAYVFDTSILSDPNKNCFNQHIVCLVLVDEKYASSSHKNIVFNKQKTKNPAKSLTTGTVVERTFPVTPNTPIRRAILNISSADIEQPNTMEQLRKDHQNDSEVTLLGRIENDLKSIFGIIAGAKDIHTLPQKLCHNWIELMHSAHGNSPQARQDRVLWWIGNCIQNYGKSPEWKKKAPHFTKEFEKLQNHIMLLQSTTLSLHTAELIQMLDQFVDNLASDSTRVLFRACREMVRLLEKSPQNLMSTSTSYVVANSLRSNMFNLEKKTKGQLATCYNLARSPKVLFQGYINCDPTEKSVIAINFSNVTFCKDVLIALELFVMKQYHLPGSVLQSRNCLPDSIDFDTVRLHNPVVKAHGCDSTRTSNIKRLENAAAEDLGHNAPLQPLFFELALRARTLLEVSYHLFVKIMHMHSKRYKSPAAIRAQTVVLHTSALIYSNKPATAKELAEYNAFEKEVKLFDSSQDNLTQLGIVHRLLKKGNTFVDPKAAAFQYYFTLSRLLDLLADSDICWADHTALYCFVLPKHFQRPIEILDSNGKLDDASSFKALEEENLSTKKQADRQQPNAKNITKWLARIHNALVSRSSTETPSILIQQTRTDFIVLSSSTSNIAKLVLLVIDASYDLAETDQYKEYLNRDECTVVLSDSPHFEIRSTDPIILEAAKMCMLDLLVDNALVAASESETSDTPHLQSPHPPSSQYKRTADSAASSSNESTPFKRPRNR